MHNHFTTMLPEDKRRHEATVLQAEEALRQARSELEAAESTLAADQVAGYRARVVFAERAQVEGPESRECLFVPLPP